ncbi:MAG: RluA family pseudouridine synthase [Pseudomonadota bacterium]
MSRVQIRAVTADEDGMRLDRWFKNHFPGVGHGKLEKLLRKGEVRVDGGRSKASRRLGAGEEVRIPPLPDSAITQKKRSPVSRDDEKILREIIIFEDDAMIAINKPFGLAVQGGTKTTKHIDAMLGAFGDGDNRPRLVHRLDKETGGLLLIAKTRIAAQRLTADFREHAVDKTYWALVTGIPRPREGTIDLPIGKQSILHGDGSFERILSGAGKVSKPAVTDFQTVEEAGRLSFIAMRPLTGRTHQLRVHAAAIGCPIIGDQQYGGADARIDGIEKGLNLFCRSMTFRHPKTGKRLTLHAELTGHMKKTWSFFGFDREARVEWPEPLR